MLQKRRALILYRNECPFSLVDFFVRANRANADHHNRSQQAQLQGQSIGEIRQESSHSFTFLLAISVLSHMPSPLMDLVLSTLLLFKGKCVSCFCCDHSHARFNFRCVINKQDYFVVLHMTRRATLIHSLFTCLCIYCAHQLSKVSRCLRDCLNSQRLHNHISTVLIIIDYTISTTSKTPK